MKYALAILLIAVQAQAATLYVSTAGTHNTNAPAFGDWVRAATNIQAAINAASSGDTVMVAPGTYTASVTIDKNNITVQGGNGTLWDADRTIIDLQGVAASVGVIFSGATNSTLKGFTVTRCAGIAIQGGGSNSVIDSCVVRGNMTVEGARSTTIYDAGAGTPEIRNSIIVGNNATGVGTYDNRSFSIVNSIVECNQNNQARIRNGATLQNSIIGNHFFASSVPSGGNITNNTTNSVCRLYNIAPASDGVGTNLQWAGVAAYIPRIGSLAQGAGVGYTGIDDAKSGDGGPALWPPFGEDSLGFDSSTNSNHGTPIGVVTSISTSPFAGSYSAAFDGASGNVEVDNLSVSITSNFTVEGWFYFRNNVAGALFSFGGFVAGGFEVSRGADRKLYTSWGGTTYDTTTATYSTGSWTHIALAVSNGIPKLFVNGSTTAVTRTGSGSLFVSEPKTFHVSRRTNPGPNFYYSNQLVSDVRLWNFQRTDFADRTNRLTGTEAGLVGYWRLDETDTPITAGPFNVRNPTLQPSFMEAF